MLCKTDKEVPVENRRGKKASVIPNNSTVSNGPEKDQLTESPNPANIEPG